MHLAELIDLRNAYLLKIDKDDVLPYLAEFWRRLRLATEASLLRGETDCTTYDEQQAALVLGEAAWRFVQPLLNLLRNSP